MSAANIDIRELLKDFGLSDYEISAYLCLFNKGTATAKEVCDETGIPYTKVYEILRRLSKKGWVIQLSRKPVVYIARNPDDIFDEVKRETEKKILLAKKLLREMEESKDKGSKVSSIFVVRNLDTLKKSIINLYREVKSDLRVVIGTKLMCELFQLLEGRDDIKIRILLREGLDKPPSIGEVKVRPVILPLDILISDGVKCIISFGRLLISVRPSVYGVIIEDIELVRPTVQYFEMLWRTKFPRVQYRI